MKGKKIKRILMLFLLVLVIMSINVIYINASNREKMVDSEYIYNTYLKIVNKDNSTFYQQARFIRRSSDNAFVYCVEPQTAIDSNYEYESLYDSYSNVLGLTSQQIEKIILYTYYGYGYGTHIESKWYAITQVMIWRVILPNSTVGFTNSLNSNIDDSLFKSEINELESLVNLHNVVPSFSNDFIKLGIGDYIVLEDSNYVLDNYEIKVDEGLSIEYSDNVMSIHGVNSGNYSISFSKISDLFNNNPVVYYSSYTQNTMSIGNFEDIVQTLNVEVVSGSLLLKKLDRITSSNLGSNGESLENAKYGLFNIDDNLVSYLITDSKGESFINDLEMGSYYLKEIDAPSGYLIDDEVYFFEVSANNLEIELVVYEDIISNEIKLQKFYKNYNESILYPEEEIRFDIYNSDNDLIDTIITDDLGQADIKLNFGQYTFRQFNTKENYELGSDFTVIVDSISNDIITYELINNEIVSYLKIVKRDSVSNEVVKISGIKFKVFDVDSDEYICLDEVCEFETNEEGIVEFNILLSMGSYLIEEVEQIIDGFVVNTELLEVVLNIDSDYEYIDDYRILEVDFFNTPINTLVEIVKYGEELALDSNGYYYKEILLENVEFELYSNEDIYLLDELVYKKDTLIKTITTSSDGSVILDNLFLGKYYLVEIKTDDNHLLDESNIYFELNQVDSISEVVYTKVEVYNNLYKGTLEFIKLDKDSNIGLESTLIGIYNELSEVIYIGHTNSNGVIILNDLLVGKYYLKELEAPNNYALSEEIIEFEIINNEVSFVTMYNELIKIPDTFSNDKDMSCFIIITLIGVLLYRFRKKIISYLFLIIGLIVLNFESYSFNNFIVIKDLISTNVWNMVKEEFIFKIIPKYEDYTDYIQIPQIELFKPLYFNDDDKNIVDCNIEVIKGSNLPNYSGGNLILAAHSGIGNNAYFNEIDKLEISDFIYIKYDDFIYTYVINDIYYQDKDGNLEFKMDYNYTNLVLVTCTKLEIDKQLVISAYLID